MAGSRIAPGNGLADGRRRRLIVGSRRRGLIGPIERLADLAADIRARPGAERNRRELPVAAADLRSDDRAETRAHKPTPRLPPAHAAYAGAALLSTRAKQRCAIETGSCRRTEW